MKQVRQEDKRLRNKLKYEGSAIPHDTYGDIVVVEYQTSEEVTARFVNTGFTVTTSLSNLLRGFVKDRLHPTVFGVGILGNEKSKENGCHTKEYALWTSMLQRCYCPLFLKERPTYKDCRVSENFRYLPYFKEWCHSQFNYNEVDDKGKSFVLDKDILIKGNKVYSPETCCFVPREINALFTKSDKVRGSLPIGVTKNGYGGYTAQLRCHSKNKSLGQFKTPEEAFQVYKVAKEAHIKSLANKWKDQIDPRVYNALMKYEVEITD